MILDLRQPARRVELSLAGPPPSLRQPAIRTWLGRMVNEYQSAAVFDALADQLAEAGEHDRAEAIRRFADEERKHGILCGAVVEALGGEAKAAAEPQPAFPLHEDAGPIEAALRNLIAVSCLSETVAVALIGAEREDMPEGPLRELLTEIWAEECGHAHAGWKLVAELLPEDEDVRRRLGAYLEVAFGHLERHELSHLPETADWPAGAEAWGLCRGEDARELFYATLREVIVPGLDRLGLHAGRAWTERR